MEKPKGSESLAKALGQHGVLGGGKKEVKEIKDTVIECQLDCFQKGIYFKIPGLVQRSTTADIVKKGNTNYDEQSKIFLQQREVFSKSYFSWMDALKSYHHVHNPMFLTHAAAMKGASLNLKLASGQYMEGLLTMARNGIWNCAEFAHFALMKINESGMLKEGYTAYITSLNDPKVPENAGYYEQFQLILGKQKIYQDKNHDHVFVVIKGRDQKPAFVIDLWQNLAGDKPFIGTFKDFIIFLNERVDRQFVEKPVGQKDFAFTPL